MEENEIQAPIPGPQPMPFFERMINLFAAPGDLFENVRLTPPTSTNWIIPLLLFVVVVIAMSQIVIHTPSLAAQMEAMIQKGFDDNIAQGKMTEDQAAQAMEFARPGSPMFIVGQIAGVIIVTPIFLFLLSLVYWLLGKWGMSATAPYMKVVEVIGLTFFIGILENIVTTLLMIGFDSLHASPGLALTVLQNFDQQNKLHIALSKVNLFTFWDLTVLSIGLSRLFQRHLPKVLVLVFALWLVWTIFQVATGMKLG